MPTLHDLEAAFETASNAARDAHTRIEQVFGPNVDGPIFSELIKKIGARVATPALLLMGPTAQPAVDAAVGAVTGQLFSLKANHDTFLMKAPAAVAGARDVLDGLGRLRPELQGALRHAFAPFLAELAAICAKAPAIRQAVDAEAKARAEFDAARAAYEGYLAANAGANKDAKYGRSSRDGISRARSSAVLGRVFVDDGRGLDLNWAKSPASAPPSYYFLGGELDGLKTAKEVGLRLGLEYDYYKDKSLVAVEFRVSASFAQASGAVAPPDSKQGWLDLLNRLPDWNHQLGQQRTSGQASERVLRLPSESAVDFVRAVRFPWDANDAQQAAKQADVDQRVAAHNADQLAKATANATDVRADYAGLGRYSPTIRRALTATEVASVELAIEACEEGIQKAQAAGRTNDVATLKADLSALTQRREAILKARELSTATLKGASGQTETVTHIRVQQQEESDNVTPANAVTAESKSTVYVTTPEASAGSAGAVSKSHSLSQSGLSTGGQASEKAPVKTAGGRALNQVDVTVTLTGKAGVLAQPQVAGNEASATGAWMGGELADGLPLKGDEKFRPVLADLVARNLSRMFASTAMRVHELDKSKAPTLQPPKVAIGGNALPGLQPLPPSLEAALNGAAVPLAKTRGEILASHIEHRRQLGKAESRLVRQLGRVEAVASAARPMVSRDGAKLQAAVARLDAQLSALKGAHGARLADGARGVGRTLGELAGVARTMGYQSAGTVKAIQKLVEERRSQLARLAAGKSPDGEASADEHARLDTLGREIPGLGRVMPPRRPRRGIAQKGRGLSESAFHKAHEHASRGDTKGLFETLAPGSTGALSVLQGLRAGGHQPRLKSWFSSLVDTAKSVGSSALHAATSAAHAVGGLAKTVAKSELSLVKKTAGALKQGVSYASHLAKTVAKSELSLVKKTAGVLGRGMHAVGGAVAQAAHKAWDITKHGVSAAVSAELGAAKKTGGFFKSLWTKATGVVGAIGGKIKRGISTGLSETGHWIGDKAKKVGGALLSAAKFAGKAYLNYTPMGLLLKAGWNKYGNQITSFAKAAWSATKTAAKAVGHFVQSPVGQLVVSGLSAALTFVPGGILLKAGIGAAMGAIEAYSKGGDWKQVLAGAAMGGLEGAVPFLKGGLAIASKVALGAAKGALPMALDGKKHGFMDYAKGVLGGVASAAGGDLVKKFGGGKLVGKIGDFMTGKAGTKGVLGKLEHAVAGSGALQKLYKVGTKFAPKIIKGATTAYKWTGKAETVLHGMDEGAELLHGGLEGAAWLAKRAGSKEWAERLETGAKSTEEFDKTYIKKADQVVETAHHYLGVGLQLAVPGKGGKLAEPDDLVKEMDHERATVLKAKRRHYQKTGEGDAAAKKEFLRKELEESKRLTPLSKAARLAQKVHGTAAKAESVLEPAAKVSKTLNEGLQNLVTATEGDTGTLGWIHEKAAAAEHYAGIADEFVQVAKAGAATAHNVSGLGMLASGNRELVKQRAEEDEKDEKYGDEFYKKHLGESAIGKRVDAVQKKVKAAGEREQEWEYKKQLKINSQLGKAGATATALNHFRRSTAEERYEASVATMKRHVSQVRMKPEEKTDEEKEKAKKEAELAERGWRLGKKEDEHEAKWEEYEKKHGEGESEGGESEGGEKEAGGEKKAEGGEGSKEKVGGELVGKMTSEVEKHAGVHAAQVATAEEQTQNIVHAENLKEQKELGGTMAHHAKSAAEHPEEHAHELAAHQEKLDAQPHAPEHALAQTVDAEGIAGGTTPHPAVEALPLVAAAQAQAAEPPPPEDNPLFDRARSYVDRFDARVSRDLTRFQLLGATDPAGAQELYKSILLDATPAEEELDRLGKEVGHDPQAEAGLGTLASRLASIKSRLHEAPAEPKGPAAGAPAQTHVAAPAEQEPSGGATPAPAPAKPAAKGAAPKPGSAAHVLAAHGLAQAVAAGGAASAPIPGAGAGDVAYLGEFHEDTWIGSGSAARPIAEGLATDFHFADRDVNEPSIGGELSKLGGALSGLGHSVAGAAGALGGLGESVAGAVGAAAGLAGQVGELVGMKDNPLADGAKQVADFAGWLKKSAGEVGKKGGIVEKYGKQAASVGEAWAKKGLGAAAGQLFRKGKSGGLDDGPAPVVDAASYSDAPQRLDYGVMSGMERFLGSRFSDVKIHTGKGAELITKRFDAEAVTIREHIFFAPGRFNAHSLDGRKLLAHELTHVAQRGRPNLDTRTAEEEAHHAEAAYGSPGMEILDLSQPKADFTLNMAGADRGPAGGPRTAKKERSISHASSSNDGGVQGEDLLDLVGERVYELLLDDTEDELESR